MFKSISRCRGIIRNVGVEDLRSRIIFLNPIIRVVQSIVSFSYDLIILICNGCRRSANRINLFVIRGRLTVSSSIILLTVSSLRCIVRWFIINCFSCDIDYLRLSHLICNRHLLLLFRLNIISRTFINAFLLIDII